LGCFVLSKKLYWRFLCGLQKEVETNAEEGGVIPAGVSEDLSAERYENTINP